MEFLNIKRELLNMTEKMQHYLNPLHIYCRLRDLGISKGIAESICRIYENYVFNIFLVKG